jgi:prepilin-type N-terminal cleavage/methylation domain-containing protein
MMRGSLKKSRGTGGFTLIELMVSLAIFAFMTAFLLAKYGTFNQSTLVTNLAYDAALTIRSAQSYGLNVQGTTVQSATNCNNVQISANSTCFFYPYGVYFDLSNPTRFIFFTDINGNGQYASSSGELISTYNMNKGYTIQSLCAGSLSSCTSVNNLNITFKRPNPDAIIIANNGSPVTYAKITFVANNTTSSVVVQSTGEISVGN